MFYEVPLVIIVPIFERAIYPYDPVLKKVRSKLIGETTAIRLVPAQDGLFALILWYIAKTLFRS